MIIFKDEMYKVYKCKKCKAQRLRWRSAGTQGGEMKIERCRNQRRKNAEI